ncbi:hypothetical protein ACFY7H_29690 [Streptomyces sp. NPDC012794]|uniref:hypothetical protein n=1 Tax=Streptomyces sp. NPDC012794 TaxID=3364850 RepID=UPI0036CCA786
MPIRESKAERATRLDLLGVLLATAGLLALILPLAQSHELGWPAWPLVTMTTSVPVLGVFVLWERRVARQGASPLVVQLLFTRRAFAGARGSTAVRARVRVFFLAWTLYLQLGAAPRLSRTWRGGVRRRICPVRWLRGRPCR